MIIFDRNHSEVSKMEENSSLNNEKSLETEEANSSSDEEVVFEVTLIDLNEGGNNQNVDIRLPIKGLENFGFTCYFNAVMQVLSQSSYFIQALKDLYAHDCKWKIPQLIVRNGHVEEDSNSEALKITLHRQSPFISIFLELVRRITSNSGESGSVNPNLVFLFLEKEDSFWVTLYSSNFALNITFFLKHILDFIKDCSQSEFDYMDQQDSHDFLRLFLNVIGLEETERNKEALYSYFRATFYKSDFDENDKKLIEAYEYYASHTVVNKTFGGLLISVIFCKECGTCYPRLEPFMDLSLPLVQENQESNQLVAFLRGGIQIEDCKGQDMEENNKKWTYSSDSLNFKRQKKKMEHLEEIETKRLKTNQLAEVENENENIHLNEFETLSNSNLSGHIDEDAKKNHIQENFIQINEINNNEIDAVTDNSKKIDSSTATDNFTKISTSEKNVAGLNKKMDSLSLSVTEMICNANYKCIVQSFSNVDNRLSPTTTFESNENNENQTCNLTESQIKEIISNSLIPLKSETNRNSSEYTLDSCLQNFTKPELLTDDNKYNCEKCTEIKRQEIGVENLRVYSNASKHLLIFSPPPILTLHLKRFQLVGMNFCKMEENVKFPLILDISPYCSSSSLILPHMASVKEEILYSLYGIVEHSGSLDGGHYIAYVKVSKRILNHSFIPKFPLDQYNLEQLLQKCCKTNSSQNIVEDIENTEEKQWYCINDERVKEVSEDKVLKCEAYLLFYERIK
ncbi:ubiquitin carboxyl-terminal hydrolase 45 [Caerostris extrusa]|uniref:Ubiquitin carboxyl-terminal hydrolase 45 n=1 Tax=Caerostris extrusa TaxID=172846 RepID=A0AAV4UNV3_CAEEX|nr:ubiquitin carboxyl-terminal hydrolase 45 [Caerostris extrusa]